MKKDRIEYFDLLKILAAFFVIVLHVSANNFSKTEFLSLDWNILNIFNSLSRWTVPCFVMISGALFLRKDYTIKEIFKKYILKLIIAYILWSIVYTLIIYEPKKIIDFINYVIKGFYHMWYVPMIIGLYMLTPILRKIVVDSRIFNYFLILLFILCIIIPTIQNIITYFDNKSFISLSDSFKEVLGNIGIKFSYCFYYLLGYYLYQKDIVKNKRKIIYIIGIFGLISTIILTFLLSRKSGILNQLFYGNFNINVLFMTIAIFTFAKYSFKSNNFLYKISTYGLGIYLVHVLILEKFGLIFHFNVKSFPIILSVPTVSLIIFITSLLIIFIIKHIPILKKYS